MKLYYGTTKRIAKKVLRSHQWNKLNQARNLKPGDLISTCIGWNQVIAEIHPEWCYKSGLLKGRVIRNFDIYTTDGSSHSILHCCTFPLESKQEIVQYWKGMDTPEYLNWYNTWSNQTKFEDSDWGKICYALKRGEEVFLENGTRNPAWQSQGENK